MPHLEPLHGPLEGIGALAAPRLRCVRQAARSWAGLLVVRVIQGDRLIVLPFTQSLSLPTVIRSLALHIPKDRCFGARVAPQAAKNEQA